MTIFEKIKAEMVAWFSGEFNVKGRKSSFFTLHIPLEDGPFEDQQERHSQDSPRELVIGPLSLESARNWLMEEGFVGGWKTGFYDIPKTIGSIKMTLDDGAPPFFVFPNHRNQVRVEPVFELNHLSVVKTKRT